MATRNQVMFRGIFEKVYDQAHCRLRLIAKQAQKTRALPGQEFEVGHIERTLFRAREPQRDVDYFGIEKEAMLFGQWLAAAAPDCFVPPQHWLDYHRTKVYGPTVEVIEVRESLDCGYETRWNN
jgi:hypothetical protein